MFTKKFEENLISNDLTKITVDDINSILLDKYWNKFESKFGIEGLENSLAIVLSAVILSTKPNQPAFFSKILRTFDSFFGDTAMILKNVAGGPELIIDHYLNRNLGLVKTVEDNRIILTEKAEKIIKRNQFLWEIYAGKAGKSKKVKRNKL